MQMLIDTHCHVLKEEYDNVDEVINNAKKNGVDKLIINGYDLKTSREAIEIANKYDFVYAAIGIGPENIDRFSNGTMKKLEQLITNKKVVAIGEIGLDFYWTKENADLQEVFFKEQVLLAKKYNLPVIVHNRDATKKVYDILKSSGVTGIIHCYSGSLEMAREFVKIGFMLGIGGVVTFKNADKIKSVVKEMDVSSLALETDSPYLSPEPYRGRKNEPSNIRFIASKIAELKGVSANEVLNASSSSVMAKFDL